MFNFNEAFFEKIKKPSVVNKSTFDEGMETKRLSVKNKPAIQSKVVVYVDKNIKYEDRSLLLKYIAFKYFTLKDSENRIPQSLSVYRLSAIEKFKNKFSHY